MTSLRRFGSSWILYTLLLVVFWGVWGAFSSKPSDDYGYPSQLVYVIWALTMLIPAFFSMRAHRFDRRPVAALYGMIVGLSGAAGQLFLFKALELGPAYLVFPIVSASPAITVLLALVFLRERLRRIGIAGVVLALVAIVLLSITDGGGSSSTGWIPLAIGICIAWGVQAFFMRGAATHDVPESTTFGYMTLSGLLLIPVAFALNSGHVLGYPWQAPALAAGTQLLNAIGALFLVMALARGRAVVVAPAANALAPVLTVVISLAVYATLPSIYGAIGIVCALLASGLLVYDDERDDAPSSGAEAEPPRLARQPPPDEHERAAA